MSPPGISGVEMTKRDSKESVPEEKMASTGSAGSAAAAGSVKLAKQQQQENLPGKVEKSNFFDMCDQDQLDKIKDLGQGRLNQLINDNADDFYNIQSELVVKADLAGKRTSCIAAAIRDQTDHLLGFILPGQVMMLLKEDKLENDMTNMKTDLASILKQLSYYKLENQKIKTVVDTSNQLVRTMVEKIQEQTNLIKEMQSDAKATKAEIAGLRNEIYLSRVTDRGQRPPDTNKDQDQDDQANRGQSNSRGRGGSRGRGQSRPGYLGPKGGQKHPDTHNIPHVTGGIGTAFDSNSSSNKFHMDNQGKTSRQKRDELRQENIYGNGNKENQEGFFENDRNDQNDQGFQNNKKNRNKNKNKNPETVNMTKKQARFAKEVIIHKVPSQKEGEYKDEEEYKEKEAAILFDIFEELSPLHLGHEHGVVIDIEKDIDYMDRFDKHFDQENFGMAPIRLRFFTVKMCNKVLQAAKRAACLKGRRPGIFGKYATPKRFDEKGNFNEKADGEAKRLASTRPAFYFRPSLPKEERLTKEAEKKARIEKKDDPDTVAFRERRKENLEKRVRFGKARNFGKSQADEASKKSVQDKENQLKDIREKKAEKKAAKEKEEFEKEKARLENLELNKVNFPVQPPPIAAGRGGPFEDLINGNKQEADEQEFKSKKNFTIKAKDDSNSLNGKS